MADETAELLSLGLTPVTIMLSALVICLWWSETWRVFKVGPKTPQCWFIIGVVIAFSGAVVDNGYWGAAWTAEYLQSEEAANWLFDNGMYSNIVFRQGFGTVAAYCHIRAAYDYADKSVGRFNADQLTLIGLVLGAASSLVLSIIKRFWN